MFESFDPVSRYLIYRSLLNSVRSDSGLGFQNDEQGHLAYRGGAMGVVPDATIGDHPDQNRLYKMMRELSDTLKDNPDLRRSDLVLSWQDFCKMAVESHDAPAGGSRAKG